MNQSKFIFKRDSFHGPIYTDVFYPTQSNRNVPAAITIALHGGGFVVGSKDMIPRPQIQHLVQLGFVVVAPNYRLCPTISLYDGPLEDARDCYKWTQIDLPELLRDKVTIDPMKITTLGFSAGATLALLLSVQVHGFQVTEKCGQLSEWIDISVAPETSGLLYPSMKTDTPQASMPTPPCAVAAFYGAHTFSDSFWHSPLPELSQLPEFDQDFLSMVYEEKDPSATMIDLEHPDLANPRIAWFFTALKEGHHIRDIVKDGNYGRVDPRSLFSDQFPPTVFIHGTADTMIESRFSVDACAALKDLGVEAEIVLVEQKNHAFDESVKEGDDDWEDILKGLNFLANHV